jgi:hypothetical protein
MWGDCELIKPISNNIQDRPNLEMMTHLEGPIVDSFYETALHSWYNRLEPILPCIAQAYQPPPGGYRFGGNNPYFAEIEVVQAAKAARKLLRRETAANMEGDDSQYEEGFMMTVRRAMERAAAVGGERWDEFVSNHTGEDNPLQMLRGRVRAGFASRPASRRPSMDLIPKMPRESKIILGHLPLLMSSDRTTGLRTHGIVAACSRSVRQLRHISKRSARIDAG